ncbi:MAG: ribonuclease III [Tissierellales bacterium]
MRHVKDTERLHMLDEIQTKIGYRFNNVELLSWALTHSSYANEHKRYKITYNERLEFLGDSVLGLIVSDYIFTKYSNYPEGELTKLRATVVCEPSLSYVAKQIDLGRYMLLGKGEEVTGGRDRVSILADAFEALIGSIYLDGKFNNAKNFVLKYMTGIIENAVDGRELFIDYKTQLQEILQKKTKSRIEYKIISEEGPDHSKVFHTEVMVRNKVLGKGFGKSKKEAEQYAAKIALERIEAENEH